MIAYSAFHYGYNQQFLQITKVIFNGYFMSSSLLLLIDTKLFQKNSIVIHRNIISLYPISINETLFNYTKSPYLLPFPLHYSPLTFTLHSQQNILTPYYYQQNQHNNIQLMFVKETYDNRLKHEEEENGTRLIAKKNKNPPVGSIKNDKLNYDRDQQFFSKEDIPLKAKLIKEQVKNLIDPDHLGFRKRPWNTSVSVPKKIESEETHQQKLLKIKLGFMDHPIPKFKQPRIFQGTETRDDYTKWNVSNEVIRKQMKENLLKTTMSAYDNTKIKEKRLLKQYLDPLGKTTQFIDTFQKDWEQKQALREQLRKRYEFQNPNASQEKTSAAVFRLVYQSTIKRKKDDIEALAMKTDFKATLSQTQQNRLSLVSGHSGIWQSFKQRIGPELVQTWAWSCCMSQDMNSKGCINKLKDGNKWNLTSFNA